MPKTFQHIATSDELFLISGPCVIEDEQTTVRIAESIKQITETLNIPWIFKASYKKANRSSIHSFTGLDMTTALEILDHISTDLEVLCTTDVHECQDVGPVAEVVDLLQVPAFLCRQTELLLECARTGLPINVKKGQFMSAEAMKNVVEKIRSVSDAPVFLTERGTSFGYQDLVVDYRGIPTMTGFADKVIMDCTHSLQQPNQSTGVTGGRPEMIETMAYAALAAGANGLFIETHTSPQTAKSDGATMLPIERLESLLNRALKIYNARHS